MAEAELLRRPVKQGLKLRMAEPRNGDDVSAAILSHVHHEVAFGDIMRQPAAAIIVPMLFLPETRTPLDDLLDCCCLCSCFLQSHYCFSFSFFLESMKVKEEGEEEELERVKGGGGGENGGEERGYL